MVIVLPFYLRSR